MSAGSAMTTSISVASTNVVERIRTVSKSIFVSGWNPMPRTTTVEPAGRSPLPGLTSLIETLP